MKLFEIENMLEIDPGAPMPLILSNDSNLYILFYELDNDETITTVKFDHYSQYKFGLPNDETLEGHPYYPLGLEWYSFYEVKDSDWIQQLMQIDKVHEGFNENNWELQKHYILTFHDNTFECIAESFDVQRNLKGSMYDQACTILNKILK